MIRKQDQAGYSLIEVLVSITILLVAIAGPMTIASNGLKNSQFAQEQNLAFFIAQSGIEKITQSRNEFMLDAFTGGSDTWNGWANGITNASLCGNATEGCGFRITDNDNPIACGADGSACDIYQEDVGGSIIYSQQADPIFSSPTQTIYRHRIFTETAGADAVRVRSVVEWRSNVQNRTEQVELQAFLYNIYGL